VAKSTQDPFTGIVLAGVILMVGAAPARAQWPPTQLLRFEIDQKTPPHQLLPPPPKAVATGAQITADLSRVPEIHFQEPILAPKGEWHDYGTSKASIQIAHQMAKINLLNKQKRDFFLVTLLEARPDLAGLPFIMGDAARLRKADLADFRSAMENFEQSGSPEFWASFDKRVEEQRKEKGPEGKARFAIAGLMQILAPDASHHAELVKRLAAMGRPVEQEATEALARLAIFSEDEKARQAAVIALQKRPAGPTTAILIEGLRYPWLSVAQHSAEAIVQLERTDLLGELVKLLEEPDPRAPATRTIKGQERIMVRELVRIHHARNCLLCHPPGNAPDVMKPSVAKWSEIEKGVSATSTHYPNFDREIVLGAVPIPGHSAPTRGGYRVFQTDRVVRADVTYLRPDFSRLHKMTDLGHWPEMQRFDYLVRSRVLGDGEAQVYRKAFPGQGGTAPYRQLALDALRRLTGINGGASADEWRKVLKRTGD
jgi:hypothetical protein